MADVWALWQQRKTPHDQNLLAAIRENHRKKWETRAEYAGERHGVEIVLSFGGRSGRPQWLHSGRSGRTQWLHSGRSGRTQWLHSGRSGFKAQATPDRRDGRQRKVQ